MTMAWLRSGLVAWALPTTAFILLWFPACRGRGQDLEKMPRVPEVLAKTQGVDAVDTLAHQTVALYNLSWIVRCLSAGGEFGNDMTQAESALVDAYNRAKEETSRQGLIIVSQRAPRSGPDAPAARWQRALYPYQRTELGSIGAVWPEIANIYHAAAQDRRRKANAAMAESQRRLNERLMGPTPDFWSKVRGTWEPRTTVFFVAGMVGLAILILARWVARVPDSRMTYVMKERLLIKAAAVCWVGTLGAVWMVSIILLNRKDRNTIIPGIETQAWITAGVLGIAPHLYVRRYLKRFAAAVQKQYRAFLASAGAVDHDAFFRGSGIAISGSRKVISFMEDDVCATYAFKDVRSWECRTVTPSVILGADTVALHSANRRMAVDALDKCGVYVSVRDVNHPVWHLRIRDQSTMDRWHEVLTQSLAD